MAIDTNKYKVQLERELQEVTEELGTLGVHNPDNPDDWIATPEPASGEADENVVADRVEDWDEKVSTLAALETRYNDIKRALGKIEQGMYGMCEVSGEEIETERLDVNPEARTCIAHKEEEENLPS